MFDVDFLELDGKMFSVTSVPTFLQVQIRTVPAVNGGDCFSDRGLRFNVPSFVPVLIAMQLLLNFYCIFSTFDHN
ncbi:MULTISPECIES: hypothetical protein [Candidatus Ichthyocystis]|uniref:Putative membrane protein n=1 Tax=Candidatus Ichthyocystis hellenicum TaxID=1561003 RepID=A0A0S4M566_9BURK|nr:MULTISPECIES: hypothetical protein [Ichthyocystis]CUT17398.1 putative membrane protein [Candidatus Ichthyocystis hellenicum]